ncbi:hypothetical protein SteCoe_28575 [Stentor coeruleus]|uniref:Uncharacterized protein n=1 Tax=Stentor coeruleus TaxID=5963 RepID=A0A1R2B7V9_9CILI|nr:hypothetical protein SteCoe_28575 [Stentor coeruleus]
MLFTPNEHLRDPPVRKGIKLFNNYRNHQSIFEPNFSESPNKLIGQKVSLSEYSSVLKKDLKENLEPEIPEEPSSPESSSPPDKDSEPISYLDSINNLKLELNSKEEEIKKLQEAINNYSSTSNPYAKNTAINKELFDKMYIQEKKRNNSVALSQQISELEAKRKIEVSEREREMQIRLDMLDKVKEEKIREQYDNKRKVLEYKNQLDMQKAYLKDVKFNESFRGRQEKPNEFYLDHIIDSPNAGYISGQGKYTKKSPRSLVYNPITGVLKETPLDELRTPSMSQDYGAVYNGYSNYQPRQNIFRAQDYPADDKSRNLIGYGNFIMQSK